MDMLLGFLGAFWDKILMIGVLVIFFAIVLPTFSNAEESGTQLGTTTGRAAGYAAGILEADTKTAEENGKNEALTNQETEFKTVGPTNIQEIGKLNVLVAGLSLDNFLEFGNKYAALFLLKADAVFSVNLGKADVKYVEEEEWLRIRIPQPEVEVFFDDSATEKVAEWQKNFFSGSGDDGYQVYLNSRKEIAEEAPQKLLSNAVVMKSARDAAEQQVEQLAKSIYGTNVSVTVEFQ